LFSYYRAGTRKFQGIKPVPCHIKTLVPGGLDVV
jgi:hypothetical protein